MNNCLNKGYELSFPERAAKYTIIDVIGRGASTIAYLASDESGIEYILKEYCPHALHLERNSSGALLCSEKDRDKFERGKQEFIEGANKQKLLRNIIRLRNETPPFHGIYEANNTLYLVVTPYAGRTLDRLDAEPLLTKAKICCAVAKLALQYHNSGYLCLDIKPDNIFVLTNSSEEILTELVEYIDFDSIRKKNELSFGRSLSFTKLWAAPEQCNPYSYNKICESTDIYAIGELLFWLVFGRHSNYDEHRSYSVYPFDEVSDTSIRQAVSRTAIQNTLSEIFHSTLRSSARNRFQSIGELTPLLEKLVSELENKAYIVESAIRPKDFFVGRTAELEQINAAIKEHDVVFVSGIAGIGKSELVKQYVCAHKKEYDNVLYWVYDGSLETAIAKNSTVQAKGIQRIPEETDPQFAVRLLKRIREISKEYQYNNLIVIDNMDCLLEEMPSQEAWEQINHIPGKILLTTRTVEPLYTTVMIDVISDSNDLICLFGKYCQFPEEERESVRRIIEAVDSHTLLVELLAHYTSATHSTPTHTLEQMKEHGIGKLSTESVRILKDGKLSSDSVFSHVNRIFSMESIDKGQTLTLAMLAFLPPDGVFMEKFKAFYSIENYETLNWLIAHGWISSINTPDEVIRIHPTVATIAVERLKADPVLCDRMFSAFTQAIQVRKAKNISEREQVLLANSLAQSTSNRFAMNDRNAIIFIERYIDIYSDYGNIYQMLKLTDFVITTAKEFAGNNTYSVLLEEGYYLKAIQLIRLYNYEGSIEICEEHLILARKNKDVYFAEKWCIVLTDISRMVYSVDYPTNFDRYYLFRVLYSIRRLISDSFRKEPRFVDPRQADDYKRIFLDSEKRDEFAICSSASMLENKSYLFLDSKRIQKEIAHLKLAIKTRIKANCQDENLRNTQNSFEIVLDRAKIAFLSGEYNEAETLLNDLATYSATYGLAYNSTTYRIHQFLAYIALQRIPQDYSKAIQEFNLCIELSEKHIVSDTYATRLELGYIYIISGNSSKATEFNKNLLRETSLLAPEAQKTYFADSLRNIGILYYVQGKKEEAQDTLKRALQEYISKAYQEPIAFLLGTARTERYLSCCYASESNNLNRGNLDEAIRLMTNAKHSYEKATGLNHPEAIDCLKQLEKLRSQL